MNKVTTKQGSVFHLSDGELARLRAAKDARQADAVFDGCRDCIPPASRCSVWLAVDFADLVDRT